MAETLTDVLVAGYQDVEVAMRDFDALAARVGRGDVEIEGMIMVTHANDGTVSVRKTGDHLGPGWSEGSLITE